MTAHSEGVQRVEHGGSMENEEVGVNGYEGGFELSLVLAGTIQLPRTLALTPTPLALN
jgi:hypothetical protein